MSYCGHVSLRGAGQGGQESGLRTPVHQITMQACPEPVDGGHHPGSKAPPRGFQAAWSNQRTCVQIRHLIGHLLLFPSCHGSIDVIAKDHMVMCGHSNAIRLITSLCFIFVFVFDFVFVFCWLCHVSSSLWIISVGHLHAHQMAGYGCQEEA